MAKESSIAPKERINVTFKPATGGAQEEIELPLKVMVLGDFLRGHDPRRLIDRKPININKNNFEDVVAKQNLKLTINVPNRLSDEAGSNDLPVSLSFNNLRDFSPEGLARQVPELNKLLELREALVSLKGPLGNMPAFRKAIEESLSDPAQRDKVIKELALTNEPKDGNGQDS
ncbi:MAG: type VI secretion system contractile sheath small subunit [Deltaproteobacteria bacterium]|jgi:type VI secretion system protein ImpB|nr:type VI secretion system contractile sheath small subunit [Deltaproteobacteria bacterium]